MTKKELKALMKKEAKDYYEEKTFDMVSGTLEDGTQFVIHFKDAEKVIYQKPEEELSDFNKKLVHALNYNPKEDKNK